jgi:hypothetical protein
MFARIEDGIVAELFTPPDGVPLADCFTPDIAAQFVAVPGGVSPEQGWLYNGTTFAAPPPPPGPTAGEIALAAYAAFIAGGLTIISTGTPAISGTYSIDATVLGDITDEAQFISTFAEFTTGSTTNLPWPMPNGTTVIFPTTAAFLAFTKAAGQAAAAAKMAVATASAMPSATVTIP